MNNERITRIENGLKDLFRQKNIDRMDMLSIAAIVGIVSVRDFRVVFKELHSDTRKYQNIDYKIKKYVWDKMQELQINIKGGNEGLLEEIKAKRAKMEETNRAKFKGTNQKPLDMFQEFVGKQRSFVRNDGSRFTLKYIGVIKYGVREKPWDQDWLTKFIYKDESTGQMHYVYFDNSATDIIRCTSRCEPFLANIILGSDRLKDIFKDKPKRVVSDRKNDSANAIDAIGNGYAGGFYDNGSKKILEKYHLEHANWAYKDREQLFIKNMNKTDGVRFVRSDGSIFSLRFIKEMKDGICQYKYCSQDTIKDTFINISPKDIFSFLTNGKGELEWFKNDIMSPEKVLKYGDYHNDNHHSSFNTSDFKKSNAFRNAYKDAFDEYRDRELNFVRKDGSSFSLRYQGIIKFKTYTSKEDVEIFKYIYEDKNGQKSLYIHNEPKEIFEGDEVFRSALANYCLSQDRLKKAFKIYPIRKDLEDQRISGDSLERQLGNGYAGGVDDAREFRFGIQVENFIPGASNAAYEDRKKVFIKSFHNTAVTFDRSDGSKFTLRLLDENKDRSVFKYEYCSSEGNCNDIYLTISPETIFEYISSKNLDLDFFKNCFMAESNIKMILESVFDNAYIFYGVFIGNGFGGSFKREPGEYTRVYKGSDYTFVAPEEDFKKMEDWIREQWENQNNNGK